MKKYGPSAIIVILALLDIAFIYWISKDQTEWIIQDKKITTSSKVVTREEVTKNVKNDEENKEEKKEEPVEVVESPLVEEEPIPAPTPTPEPIVYEGMTMADLSLKLEKNLYSNLKGYGSLFASYSIELGIDPYLALAITLHETGCEWGCSTLVKTCNNVGGMKGSPRCGGGSYKSFPTLEEGIKSYLDNLYNNYYRYGLTTPEAMNAKYAESRSWSSQVNTYINKIRAS